MRRLGGRSAAHATTESPTATGGQPGVGRGKRENGLTMASASAGGRWRLLDGLGDACMSGFIQRLATRSWQSMPSTTMYPRGPASFTKHAPTQPVLHPQDLSNNDERGPFPQGQAPPILIWASSCIPMARFGPAHPGTIECEAAPSPASQATGQLKIKIE